jgi:OPA family glycerol-3-phosphate transporter-like MFS transporter
MTAPAVIDERFRRRRVQNWVFLGLMYAMFYMARYNLSVADPYLLQAFGWTKEDLGILKSAGLITYGISVFLNGPIADRIGGKRALLIGAAGSAASNVVFALLGAKLAAGGGGRGAAISLAVVSAVNYYFQSFGALSIVKVNASWFNVRERGSFAGIFGIMIQLGRLLPFAVGAQLLAHLPWPSVFLVPAGALLLLFAIDFFLVEDSPAAAGLGEFDTEDESPEEAAKKVSLLSVLARFFTQPVAYVIAGASFCTGIVRQGILDQWSVLYFKEVHGLLPNAAIVQLLQAWLIPVFSVISGLAAGIVSDRVFGARRGPVIAIAFAGQLVALLLLGRAGSALGAALLLAGLQFFIQGGHSLIGGAASMDFGGRKAVATAAGLFDGMQYAAGAVVTYGMGKLLTRFGWSSWTYIVLPFVVIGMALAASLWNTLPKRGGLHGGAPVSEPTAAKPAV